MRRISVMCAALLVAGLAGLGRLSAGDAASTEDPGRLTITAKEDAEALLFDLG